MRKNDDIKNVVSYLIDKVSGLNTPAVGDLVAFYLHLSGKDLITDFSS